MRRSREEPIECMGLSGASAPPPPERGVGVLLAHPTSLPMMLQAARQGYQEELALWWLAANEWRLSSTRSAADVESKVYDVFMRADTEHEVTLSMEERAQWEEALAEAKEAGDPLPEDFFEELFSIVEGRLTEGVLPKYIALANAPPPNQEAMLAEQARVDASKREASAMLEALLSESENFIVFYALCKTYVLNEDHGASQESTFLSGVMEILLQNDAVQPFLRYVAQKEVDACTRETTLFRERTVYTLLVGDLFRRQESVAFLARVFGSVYKEALACGALNPHSELGARTACDFASEILDNIVSDIHKCPKTLRRLFMATSKVTAEKFPALKYPIVGNLLFLRWVNPALIIPELYGLCKEAPESLVRKNMTLVAKLLQNACNLQRFDDDGSLGHALLNKWLDEHTPDFEALFVSLTRAEGSESPTGREFTTTPEKEKGSRRRMKIKRPSVKSPKVFFKNVKQALSGKPTMGKKLTSAESEEFRNLVLLMMAKYQRSVEDMVREEASSNVRQKWDWLKALLRDFS